MRRSQFKPKILTDAQRQIKEEWRKHKADLRAIGQAGKSRTGARGSYHNGTWVSSQWELECLKMLELRQEAGRIKDLKHREIITFSLYNEAGQRHKLQIEMDFTFFDLDINRYCRWDAKPPKVVHTKSGRKYPQKIHEAWLQRFELLQFAQPDFNYRLLVKGNCWEEYDLNIVKE